MKRKELNVVLKPGKLALCKLVFAEGQLGPKAVKEKTVQSPRLMDGFGYCI